MSYDSCSTENAEKCANNPSMGAGLAHKIHLKLNVIDSLKEYNFLTTCSLLPCNDKATLFREGKYSWVFVLCR